VHHQGDLLTPGPGCPEQPTKALLRRSFFVAHRTEPGLDGRWIQA
jgi:hypothetical protein